jgi:hypothetical protein
MSLLSTVPIKTNSITELSQALFHYKSGQSALVRSTGYPGTSGRRQLLRKVAKNFSKPEVEVMAAITSSHMSRETANKLLGLVTCVSEIQI